uniref:THAP-type domain-containing protein n=1 Tax=Amphimedon queenslandica TaxID=400682 RepID=A0A1X7T5A5_AMPQE
MGRNCVAAGCTNTYKSGVSLFSFPKDKQVRNKWIKEVQKTKACWKGPSDYSCVCSDHFT